MKNVDDILPLSPMQRLMLTRSLAMASSSALSNQFLYRISGPLDITRFCGAWQSLIDRHAALRTVFVWEAVREPVQVIRSRATLDFNLVDLGGLDEATRNKRFAEVERADRRNGFDLRRAPLFRITVVRFADDDHRMLWSRHHLVLDRWCVDIIFDELLAAYHEPQRAEAVALPSTGSFRSYVQWLQGQDAEQAEHYWREALGGLAEPSLLVDAQTRRERAPAGEFRSMDVVVEASVHARARDLAKSARISQAALFQGAVSLLLARHTGLRDIVFGLTVSGRPPGVAGIETTLGSFINNLPVRQRIGPDVPLTTWLQTLHASQAARFRFEHVSPTDLHRWSGLPASEALFDLLLLMHSPATEVRTAGDIRIEQLQGPLDSAYPLTVGIAEASGRLELTAVFDVRIVGETLTRALLTDLRDIIEQMVNEPGATLAAFLPVTPAPPRSRHDAAVQAPQDVIEDDTAPADSRATLLRIWRDTLGVRDVGLDDDFFALGGTSLQAALLFTQIERQLGRVLPLSTLFAAGSVREFLVLLEEPEPRTSPVVAIQSQGNRTPLYVVPGIGGNVVGLAGLARALGSAQPLYGLQSIGLDGHEEPESRIEDIAARFVAAMPAGDHRLVLFGICWGSAVAYEIAQQLAASGRPPALLVVMDPVHVAAPPAQQPVRESRSRHLLRFVGRRLVLYAQEFRALDGAGRRAWLKSKKDKVVSVVRHRDLFSGDRTEFNQRRVADANLAALTVYRPVPYTGDCVVLLTGERKVDPTADLRRQWLRFVAADTAVVLIPGNDTGDAVSPRNVGSLAAILREQMDHHGAGVDVGGERPPVA